MWRAKAEKRADRNDGCGDAESGPWMATLALSQGRRFADRGPAVPSLVGMDPDDLGLAAAVPHSPDELFRARGGGVGPGHRRRGLRRGLLEPARRGLQGTRSD